MTTRPPTKRQQQAAETKDRIYKIAIELMDKKGFDQLTIVEISKKAGVSVGAFYHYFDSKDDILAEIFRKGDAYFSTTVATGLRLSTKSCAGKVLEYFERYADFNIATGVETMQQLYRPAIKFFIKKGRPMQAVLREIVAEGQASGQIAKDRGPDYLVDALFVLARGIVYEWCLYDGKSDLKKRMRELVKLLLAALSPRP